MLELCPAESCCRLELLVTIAVVELEPVEAGIGLKLVVRGTA